VKLKTILQTQRVLLQQAFIHRSTPEAGHLGHNERLEFLGDSVIGLILSRYLYNKFEGANEGLLSKYRAYLVNEETLSRLYLLVATDDMIRISGTEISANIRSSVFEAVVGLIFLNHGFQQTEEMLLELFKYLDDELVSTNLIQFDPKSELQQVTHKHFKLQPLYSVVQEDGPDHKKVFRVSASLSGEVLGHGFGPSKQQAEKQAALESLRTLKTRLESGGLSL